MLSNMAAISATLAMAASRSPAGSMLSTRMRNDASGVRQSWPIAPSR